MNNRLAVLFAVALVLVVAVFLQAPISQPAAYHRFADDRTLAGVPRALNVLSNVPFLFIGLLGLNFVARQPRSPERNGYLVLFAGVALTAFGSSYYHADPSNARLVWDRLPMTLGFMGLFVAMMAERVSRRASVLLYPALLLGVGSVAYWHMTESHGVGDLRPYLLIQFLPLLLIPLILWLFPPKYSHGKDVLVAIGWYGAAKILEFFDQAVFAGTGGIVSGHSLKHLAAAAATFVLFRMLAKRAPVSEKAATARL